MKKLILIAVSLAFVSNARAQDYSDKPIIDHEYREVVLELNKVTEKCRKKLNYHPIKSMSCGKELWKEYEKQGKFRGTDEYCKKHYGKLSFEELHKVWIHLKQQRRVARIVLPGNEIVPGEVTESDFMVEQFWVESRLAQMQRKRTEAAEKEVFKKQ